MRNGRSCNEALGDLQRAGRVQVDRMPTGTLADLQRQLRRNDYHVFHYIGHGGYDPQADDGVLMLEGTNQRGQQVSGQDLGVLLHDHRTLRLAVLNSCEGARGGRADPYSGHRAEPGPPRHPRRGGDAVRDHRHRGDHPRAQPLRGGRRRLPARRRHSRGAQGRPAPAQPGRVGHAGALPARTRRAHLRPAGRVVARPAAARHAPATMPDRRARHPSSRTTTPTTPLRWPPTSPNAGTRRSTC